MTIVGQLIPLPSLNPSSYDTYEEESGEEGTYLTFIPLIISLFEFLKRVPLTLNQDIHSGFKPSSPGCVGEGLGCSDVGVHREKSKHERRGERVCNMLVFTDNMINLSSSNQPWPKVSGMISDPICFPRPDSDILRTIRHPMQTIWYNFFQPSGHFFSCP